jgi:hypothetical protein
MYNKISKDPPTIDINDEIQASLPETAPNPNTILVPV